MGTLSAEHYRVEYVLAPGLKPPSKQAKEAMKFYLTGRQPVASEARDILRIFDREGNVVLEREWLDRRAGQKQEAEIVDDLLHLDVSAFRAKWGIAPPGEGPTQSEPGAGAEGGPAGEPTGGGAVEPPAPGETPR